MRKVLYIFGLLTDADVEWMARTGSRRRLADGDAVIEEDKHTASVVLLLEGEFVVTTRAVGQIGRLGVGEIVGEISLVDSMVASATVTASGACRALFLDKTVLLRKLEDDVAFGCRFYRALAIFLADRLRAHARRPLSADGHATEGGPPALQDELDIAVLDTLSAAGERFDRMLKALSGLGDGGRRQSAG
jgi:CRP-like cAMP-binding protein